MTDRELLELAAKAVSITIKWHCPHVALCDFMQVPDWNPLTNDGDALRLAVTLRLEVCVWDTDTRVLTPDDNISTINEPTKGDPYAATRRAITRAAAEIGRNMT